MKILAGQLRRGLMLVEPVVSKRHAIEILKNSVLLEDGKVVGTDLEIRVSVDLGEKMEEPFLLPLKEVMGILKYIPASEVITIERANKKELLVKWQDGQSKYPYYPPEDFPPETKTDTISELSVDGDSFISALNSVVGYCSSDEAQPVLTGIFVKPFDNGTDVTAADGFRLAVQNIPQPWFEECTIIPARVASILHHLWRHNRPNPLSTGSLIEAITAKPQLNVALVQRKGVKSKDMVLSFDGVRVHTLLIDGHSPDYRQVIPKEFDSKVTFFTEDFERTLEQLKFTAGNEGKVQLVWNEDMMTVTALDEERGSTERIVPVRADKPGRIAFNIGFLLDYLNGKQGVATMMVINEKSPTVFQHRSSPLVVIMPLFVQW